jgi:hypothetical protein
MKKLVNISIDVNVNTSEKVGTLNWTVSRLNETKLRLEITKDGRLAIVDESNTVIVKEAWTGDYSGGFHYAIHYSESGKIFNYMSTNNVSIFRCYPMELSADEVEQMKFNGGYPGNGKIHALFGRVLTPAARKLAESFIEKCAEALNRAIIARDEEESVVLDKTNVVVEIKPCDE